MSIGSSAPGRVLEPASCAEHRAPDEDKIDVFYEIESCLVLALRAVRQPRQILRLALAAALAVLAVRWRSPAAAARARRPTARAGRGFAVVAAENFWGSIAAQLAGTGRA